MNQEKSFWPWVGQVVSRYRGRLLLIVGVAVVESIVAAAIPLVWQQLIDRASSGVADYRIAAAFLALLCLNVLPLLSTLRERLQTHYRFDAQGELFSHLLRLSVPFFKDRSSTQVMLEASRGVEAGGNLLHRLLQRDLLTDIPVSVFAFVFVWSYSWIAAAVLLGFLAVFLLLSGFVGKRLAAGEAARQELDTAMAARQREVLASMEAVKLHRAEPDEQERRQQAAQAVATLEYQLDWLYGLFEVLSGFAGVLPLVVSTVIFLPQVAAGEMTVGLLVALQLYSSRAVGPAGFLGRIYQEAKRDAVMLRPALRLLLQQPTVVEPAQPVEMKPLRHEIAVRHLTFQYPGADRPTLRDVSMVIAAGAKVAIVGPNGSGKSTLARLMVRFYDPDHGLITYDGTDLRLLSFGTLYQQIAYVTQEVPVFSGTIGENVAYGWPTCPEERIRDACQRATADFIFRQPQGLRTAVGELGSKLSGGERQRLALARVFLRQPSFIILDEATAALDGLTQREIQAAFDQLLTMNGGTTCVVIAHRMSTVQNADQIVVLQNGAIVATGTHQELLGCCELYRQLCQEMAT